MSLEPRAGNPPPRLSETPCGLLNSIGLQNIGVKAFIEQKLPYLKEFETEIIANIFGETLDEYEKVAEILSSAGGVSALEVIISCPNVKKGGVAFGSSPEMAAEVTRRVKEATDLPVIMKLSPNVTDISAIAESVEYAGADAVSLINTITGMSVDVEHRKPHLFNITGGLSGPAIKPVALRMVWQTVNRVTIPVIGLGGIMSAMDALEFLIVGAKAIQIGTASFIDPRATMNVLDGIIQYLIEHNLSDISELIGSLSVPK